MIDILVPGSHYHLRFVAAYVPAASSPNLDYAYLGLLNALDLDLIKCIFHDIYETFVHFDNQGNDTIKLYR